jgi:hypothetical protein
MQSRLKNHVEHDGSRSFTRKAIHCVCACVEVELTGDLEGSDLTIGSLS